MARSGFTLIEISIVLVIIGLIVGGILTGQDLINAAGIRAQISQIEKYNTAVRTFQSKYGYLPGDIPNPIAAGLGFQSRGSNPAEGDGNGALAGNCSDTAGGARSTTVGCGELAVFWEDLTDAKMIDASVRGTDKASGDRPNIAGGNFTNLTSSSSPGLKDWLPSAKLGSNNFVYVYSLNGVNFFAVSSITSLNWQVFSTDDPGLTVHQAYSLDKKVDDGFPQTGAINACYLNENINPGNSLYAAGTQHQGEGTYSTTYLFCTPSTAQTPAASYNCFDNNNVSGRTQTYSVSNANLRNCALSFRFM